MFIYTTGKNSQNLQPHAISNFNGGEKTVAIIR
jgi:hypothetical protein